MPTIISAETARNKYPRVAGIKTPGGSPIRDNGDEVAVALRQTGLDDWLHIADENGCRDNLDALQAAGKNTGQIRMALGRILRAKLARYNADPEKNEKPRLPEPKPVPVKAAAVDPKPEENSGAAEQEDATGEQDAEQTGEE